MTRQTPLDALHRALGAKMVAFAGWDMPVSYPDGVMAEHAAARTRAALFDVSHMCQAELRGDAPAAALEALVPGGITTLTPGRARYTIFTNDRGGILDDLIVTAAGDHLYLVLNAARRAHDLQHLRESLPAGVEVVERTDLALLALQGPEAAGVMAALLPATGDLRFMDSLTGEIDGVAVRVSRLGYTGEDGFEISLPAQAAEDLARRLLDHDAVSPAGLGARDSLRLEAGLCLYGQDIDESTTPAEAGLGWAIPKRRRAAADFPGAGVILRQLQDGPPRRLTGLRPAGRAPARAGTEVAEPGGDRIGRVTSGGFGPTLGAPVSMGYVEAAHAHEGAELHLMIRGKPHPATVTPLPFVPHRYKR